MFGYNSKGEYWISNCINSGNIKGNSNSLCIGGIIGECKGTSIGSITDCKSNCIISGGTENVGGVVGYINDTDILNNCKWYENTQVKFGIGSLSSNKNATYIENLQLESVINIVNEENKFKIDEEGNLLLKWQ